MLFVLLRLIGVIWLLGFIVLALAATSSFLFAPAGGAERGQRWAARLAMALVWPVALFSSAGRARLRGGS